MISIINIMMTHILRALTNLKSEGKVTSPSGVDKREVRDNREKWCEYRER